MGSLHRVECKSHHLYLDSIISLILRCMRPIEGSSTTFIGVPDLLIFIFISTRLQTVLRDPKDQPLTFPVKIRREKRIVLELSLHSDSYPISHWGWNGIQLPQTGSVKLGQQAVPGKLLKLSIQVLGCLKGVPNAQPCPTCWRKRQPIDPNVFPSNLQPYMIDFKADNPIALLSEPSDGSCLKANITFHFTCHHGGSHR